MASELRSVAGETTEFEIGPIERDEVPVAIDSSAGPAVTTVGNHGYQTGDFVRIESHLWNPINAEWTITVTGVTTFTLDDCDTTEVGANGIVTRLAAVDLTVANTTMSFTAKETLDGVVFVSKDQTDGIDLNTPSSDRKNYATVVIDPADTSGVTENTDYYYDVWLTESDGRATRIDHGIWKLGVSVT